MTDWVTVRPGAYYDSVTLMRASTLLSELDGVDAATIAMATELNRDLVVGMGFVVPDDAGPDDLLVAIRARDGAVLDRARGELDLIQRDLLGRAGQEATTGCPTAPRTVGSAARRLDATVALISVPGPHAYVEAVDALEAGLSVVVFSDNVPVEQEVALKEEAGRRGLLVMGPDCGTVVVGGVGLGFANALRPGHVGIVAASGTGAQQVACLLDAAGTGVSHMLGVGGRDLTAEVAGRSTLAALDALDGDPMTELIVVVSKPPAPQVAENVQRRADELATPVLFAPVGPGHDDLTATTEKVLAALDGRKAVAWPKPHNDPRGDSSGGPRGEQWPHWPAPVPQRRRHGTLRGLFAGGTLCDEAMLIAAEALGPVWSNIPLRPEWKVDRGAARPSGNVLLDLGGDQFTRGRAHPMIDPLVRLEHLASAAEDPECAVVLLDVVLGYAADPNPAAALAPAIQAARTVSERDGRDLAVVVSICGTTADPQGLDGQAQAMRDAGAAVFRSNAAAAHHAVSLIEGAGR